MDGRSVSGISYHRFRGRDMLGGDGRREALSLCTKATQHATRAVACRTSTCRSNTQLEEMQSPPVPVQDAWAAKAAAAPVVAHAHDHPVDRSVLLRHSPTQTTSSTRQQPHRWLPPLPRRAREISDSVGTGFLYGTLFGGVVATVEGYRESPTSQHLRGILHHGKHVIPETAGRIALVTGLFRLASWGLETVRGGREQADLWDVLLAAPLAGAMLRIRQGPQAAARTAFMFGSVGAVMIVFNLAQAKVGRHHDSPDEVLEEIAFAEEIDG